MFKIELFINTYFYCKMMEFDCKMLEFEYKMLEFEQEHFYKLKKNTKYYIVSICDFIGTFEEYQNEIAVFRNVEKIISTIHSNSYCGYVTFAYKIERQFYKVKSQKERIQQAMEQRAITKILRKVTGDELFVW